MKKKNLLVIMMLSVGLSSCSDDNKEDGTGSDLKVQYPIEITATNFPDGNFRKYLLKQDYGKDGILTEDEIKGITHLNICGEGICSLKGIEYFIALTELDCSASELIITPRLGRSGNQLTVLDVSKNTALTTLNCSYNPLTSLDVSKNTVLTELICSNNQLTSLDVSENTALIYLYCGYNQLTALDVSKNTALTELDCSGNQLATLDVSGYTTLEGLYCSGNQLTALGISGCTILERLYCGDNQLTSLDVSGCTKLYSLSCYNNQMKGTSMDNLIKSLPIGSGSLYVYSPLSPNEGNVCTKEQVKAAKEKRWIAYYQCNEYHWDKYEGSDDTPFGIGEGQ